ncbi:MAG: primosomal protein N' [SAR324 cluster bacterium]|nr:primosomal protein N' [SAR324 cluster bacterium]
MSTQKTSSSSTPTDTIAEVAVNIPLQCTFDYRLDGESTQQIVPGSRVVVPFGRTMRSGVVVGLKDRSELPAERLKTIHSVVEAQPLFTPELLRFTHWVAEYYFCGWGEVLDAALPSGLSLRIRSIYRFRPGADTERALALLTPKLRRWFGRRAVWSAKQWAVAAPGEVERGWLDQQIAAGTVEVIHDVAGYRHGPREEKWLRNVAGGSAQRATDSGLYGKGRPEGRETRKAQVLRMVQEAGELSMARLREVMPSPWKAVRQLESEGALEAFTKPAQLPAPVSMPDVEPFYDLNPDQRAAYEAVHSALAAGRYLGFLLEGVTGSGKTEVYLHAVRETLERKRSALLLVPEIALTADIVTRFRARFGDRVAVLHSGMDQRTRSEQWMRVWQGRAPIVIGARSALFAPLPNLGLVVVDEEHDPSYKQDETPRYHARDAGLMRAREAGAVALLGSATPSMESLRNVRMGKLERLVLPSRVRNRSMPVVEILDLRSTPRQKGCAFFTRHLVEALHETLRQGDQAILFLNRRGFANLVQCDQCGEPAVCANCSLSLVYHQIVERLRCHHCDYSQPMPSVCTACGTDGMKIVGFGTERIEEEMGRLFPKARILRMDSDTLRRKGALESMLQGIRERRYDLIIGTQILTKGHDFPHITLVGAVLADVALNLPDFRASERTFHLLTQMAGRAGRGSSAGRVVIQTYQPEHHALVHVSTHDTAQFAEAELAIREAALTPPYAHMVMIWASSTRVDRAERLAGELYHRIQAARPESVTVDGPAEAPIRKLNKRYRWMVRLRAKQAAPMRLLLHRVLGEGKFKVNRPDRIVVDVDPHNLL